MGQLDDIVTIAAIGLVAALDENGVVAGIAVKRVEARTTAAIERVIAVIAVDDVAAVAAGEAMTAGGRIVDRLVDIEDLLVDAVGRGIRAAIGNDVAAVRQQRHRRIDLVAGRDRIDHRLGADLVAEDIEALGEDVVIGTGAVVFRPGDDIAAVAQHADAHALGIAGRGGVDRGFAQQRCAGVIEALGVNLAGRAVIADPGDDETRLAAQIDGRGHRREILVAGRGGVDARLRADRRAGVVEALHHDVVIGGVAVGVERRGAVVNHDQAAIIERQRRRILRARRAGRNVELAADLRAGRAEALAIFAVAVAVLAEAVPGDDIAAVGQADDAGRILFVFRRGIGQGLAADLVAAGVVLLEIDAAAAIVAATAVLAVGRPHHDITAARQEIDLGQNVVFTVGRAADGIDLGFGAHRIAEVVKPLHHDVVDHRAVRGVCGIGFPDVDKAAADQAGDRVAVIVGCLSAESDGIDRKFGRGCIGGHGNLPVG